MAETIQLEGIEPKYAELSLKRIITNGNHELSKDNFGIVIGQKLADKFSAKLGDKITVFALNNDEPPSISNMPMVEQFTITGIFESGMAEYDDIYAYINFSIAENFFELNDEVTGYNINLFDITKIDSTKKKLSSLLPYPFYTRTYKDINKHIKQAHKNANIRITEIGGASRSDITTGNSSPYSVKNDENIKPEQKELKERIQRQGYGDGAHIPHSKITKYGKY